MIHNRNRKIRFGSHMTQPFPVFKYWRECLNTCGSSVIVILFNTLIMENVVKELFNSSVSNLKN